MDRLVTVIPTAKTFENNSHIFVIQSFTKSGQIEQCKMMQQETELLRQLAKSYNNLDASFIEKVLADDVIYESQWVFSRIEGKKSVFSYLDGKFETIKSSMQKGPISVTAELAFLPTRDKPCIVITQIIGEDLKQTTVLIEMNQEKIKRIDLCFIPEPIEAELTGEFPK